jgi:predicted enzyme related to lactoylglutathione lyase
MFCSLDFLYVPAADIERAIDFYVQTLGGELIWKIRDGDTTVAHVRLTDDAAGPALLLASHLEGQVPILIYRVQNLKAAMKELQGRGWQPEGRPFEIPHGPCITFRDPNGQRLALYELSRPEASAHFLGRVDL